jgi:hypothetical protein
MKAAGVILLLLVSGSMAGSLSRPTITTLDDAKEPKAKQVGIDFCPICVQFADETIDDLLNIILNAGVVGGCGDLCAMLAKEIKTDTEIIDLVCNLLCDYVGIREFINIIEKADLDPIYYCELLKQCPIDDNGDAHIVSFKVIPDDVVHGSMFNIELLFDTEKGTGTGEIDLLIDTADGIPLQHNELSEPLAPGAYNITWSVEAKPDPNCDPTQDICEQWIPGNYTANVAICNGECFSKHPHSQVYDEGKAPFNVVARD